MSQPITSNADYLSQLDKALIAAGLPQNKLNKLLKMAEENLQCDRECQRRTKIEEYKRTWNKSKDLYSTLPNTILYNEKKYYTLDKGPAYYTDNILKKKYIEQISKYKDIQIDKLDNFKNEINNMLDNYKSAEIYKSRLNELYRDKVRKGVSLKKDIDDAEKRITTDTRKIYYEDQQTDNLKYYRKFIYILYYIIPPILFIVYLIYGPFFRNKQYKDYKKDLLIILVIVIYVCIAVPSLLKNLVERIFQTVDYVDKMAIL